MRISITNNQWAVIDNDDYDDILAYTWYVSWQGKCRQKQYVHGRHTESGQSHKIRLHRLIMNVSKGDKRVVHHINGDTLDNRKCNLMIMTVSEHSILKKRTRQC